MSEKLEYTIREASELYKERFHVEPHLVTPDKWKDPLAFSTYDNLARNEIKALWLSKTLRVKVVVT